MASEHQTRLRLRDRDQWRLEEVGVFHEEWPLFGKENRKPLIDGVLRLVRFNLSEIRIHGGVEDQAIEENEFGIESGLALETS